MSGYPCCCQQAPSPTACDVDWFWSDLYVTVTGFGGTCTGNSCSGLDDVYGFEVGSAPQSPTSITNQASCVIPDVSENPGGGPCSPGNLNLGYSMCCRTGSPNVILVGFRIASGNLFGTGFALSATQAFSLTETSGTLNLDSYQQSGSTCSFSGTIEAEWTIYDAP